MYNNIRQINLCLNCSLKNQKESQKVCASSVGIYSARETCGILLNVSAAISQKKYDKKLLFMSL